MTTLTHFASRGSAIGLTMVLALTGAACASAPEVKPERQLASAETSIEFAEENGAREYGAGALDRARSQLDQAEIAAANEEYDLALRLAERAELDAELAMAQTNHLKAEQALREIQESIRILRAEIARSRTS